MDSNSKVNNVDSNTSAYCLEPLGAKEAIRVTVPIRTHLERFWQTLSTVDICQVSTKLKIYKAQKNLRISQFLISEID